MTKVVALTRNASEKVLDLPSQLEVKVSLALARVKTPKQPQKKTPRKGSNGNLWDLRAGQTDLLMVDFQNITSWPARSEAPLGQSHPKVEFLASAGAHVALLAETHSLGEGEQHMGGTLARQKFTTFTAPAEVSWTSANGSYGGAAALARTYLNTSPLAGYEKRGSVRSQSDSNYFAGCWLHFKTSCIQRASPIRCRRTRVHRGPSFSLPLSLWSHNNHSC